MLHDRKRKRLSPVLSDEPIVGQDLPRRLRVVLLSVVIAFVLTNLTSYLIGQAVRADADRDSRARLAALERDFAADLEARRSARDKEVARHDAELRQLRADSCTLADRIVPRDAAVQSLRRRYGCSGDARPASTLTVTPRPPAATPRSARPGGAARPVPAPRPTAVTTASRPPTSSGPKPQPSPSTPPPPAADDGLICLPLIGCLL